MEIRISTPEQVRKLIDFYESGASLYAQHGEHALAAWSRAEAKKWIAKLKTMEDLK